MSARRVKNNRNFGWIKAMIFVCVCLFRFKFDREIVTEKVVFVFIYHSLILLEVYKVLDSSTCWLRSKKTWKFFFPLYCVVKVIVSSLLCRKRLCKKLCNILSYRLKRRFLVLLKKYFLDLIEFWKTESEYGDARMNRACASSCNQINNSRIVERVSIL